MLLYDLESRGRTLKYPNFDPKEIGTMFQEMSKSKAILSPENIGDKFNQNG